MREPSMIRTTSQALNQAVGVGFWNKADAVAQARLEEARTGHLYALHMETTPALTHELWFVRRVRKAVA